MRGRKPIYSEALERTHILLPPRWIEALDEAAQRRGYSRSKLVRKILQVFLDSESKRQKPPLDNDRGPKPPLQVPDGEGW